jgi:hypothetical protein
MALGLATMVWTWYFLFVFVFVLLVGIYLFGIDLEYFCYWFIILFYKSYFNVSTGMDVLVMGPSEIAD